MSQLPRDYHTPPQAHHTARDQPKPINAEDVYRQYAPEGRLSEPVVATGARVAHRLIDRTTGKTYSADELLTGDGSNITDPEAFRGNIGAAQESLITTIDDASQVYANGDTSTQKGFAVTSGTGTSAGDGVKHTLAATVASTMTRFRKYCRLDLSSHAFVMDIVKDATFSTIKVTLYCGSTASPKTIASKTINGATMFAGLKHRLHLPQGDFTVTGSPTTADLQNIWAIDVELTPTSTNTTSLEIHDIFTVRRDKVARVCFQFDDARDDTYSVAAGILESYGFKGDIAVDITSVGEAGFCTLAQLQELYADGWGMMGHHETQVTSLSEADQISLHIAVKNYLLASGFTFGSDVFVYPGGFYSADSDNIASRFWGVRRPVISRTGSSVPGIFDPKAPNHVYIGNSVPASTYKSYLDTNFAAGETMVLTFHGIKETPVASEDYSIAGFTEIVAHAAAIGLQDIRYPDIFTTP